jgi:hypothetical protein
MLFKRFSRFFHALRRIHFLAARRMKHRAALLNDVGDGIDAQLGDFVVNQALIARIDAVNVYVVVIALLTTARMAAFMPGESPRWSVLQCFSLFCSVFLFHYSTNGTKRKTGTLSFPLKF